MKTIALIILTIMVYQGIELLLIISNQNINPLCFMALLDFTMLGTLLIEVEYL